MRLWKILKPLRREELCVLIDEDGYSDFYNVGEICDNYSKFINYDAKVDGYDAEYKAHVIQITYAPIRKKEPRPKNN